MSQGSADLFAATKIRNSIIGPPAAAQQKKETAVLELVLDIPCSAAEVMDAIAIVSGQTGDPSEVAFEVVGRYDQNYLADRPAALRISRNVSEIVGADRGSHSEFPTI